MAWRVGPLKDGPPGARIARPASLGRRRTGERRRGLVDFVSGDVIILAAFTMAAAAWLAIWSRRRDARLRLLAARLESLTATEGGGAVEARLASGVARVETSFAALDRRLNQRHTVSGLPTREPLLARMTEDGRGVLGVVALIDFDRLCAFDPALGERVLLAIVDRMARMLPTDRLVAHVDRAHLALWFGPGVGDDAATAQLDAIGYALGDAIPDGAREILPEIRVRLGRYSDDGASPQALLARTLASFTLAPGTPATTTGKGTGTPLLDPATAAGERYALEQDLRQAIGRGEFQMHFQPLIDAGARRVCGAEALIRWRHPTRGAVPPSRFVPVMEAMGLAHEIGLWTLNAATREARGWQVQGLAGLRVAVNVSGHQLERDDMGALVERTLARHSLGPDALEIELTEGVATGDSDRARRLFDSLRALGVRIAIDDFGTGYSSFATLRTLSFDKIKIDREFITGVDVRRDSQAICQSIIALGRGLGIRVLAEGVERAEEYHWLCRHGCAHFQGYYFSPPLVGADFVSFVRDTDGLATLLTPGPGHVPRSITERLTA